MSWKFICKQHIEEIGNNLENEICSDSSDEDYTPQHNRVSPRRNVAKRKSTKAKSLLTSNNVQEKEFVNVAALPLQSKEQNETTLICDICGVKYLTQRQLKAHIKLHKNPKPPKPKESFICEICGNIYSSKKPLNEHKKLHTGIKPHECEWVFCFI